MALITLLRHAALPFEYQKTYIGHSDISIDNSLVTMEKLKFLENRKYDYIYSSDLKRCKETLDLVNLSYETDDRLREVKFKEEIELKNFKQVEVLESYNSKYLENESSWHGYICEESLEEFKNRILSFVNSLPKNKDILICSHAGTIRMLNSILTNKNYEKSYLKIEYLEKIEVEL